MCAVSCVWGTFYDHGMVCVDRLMDPRRRGFVSQDTTRRYRYGVRESVAVVPLRNSTGAPAGGLGRAKAS